MAKAEEKGSNLNVQCFVGPVTGLAVTNRKLISGCGNELSVFDLETQKLEARTQIFTGSTVHGIREDILSESEVVLCVFGAKQACVVSIDLRSPLNGCSIIRKSQILRTPDWIWDAAWIFKEDSSSSTHISFALAHNSAVLWDWQQNKIDRVQECKEKCILYCAHFIGKTWDNLIFAAGTVFNQVVLWPVGTRAVHESEANGDDKAVEVMHTFTGHKGVIFSIRYSHTLKRLCSVSDDRSIRMWQLFFPTNKNEPLTVADWRQMESHLMFSLYGHSARVWCVTLMSTSFVSVGEDATIFVWDYEGSVIQKFKGHKGKSIWSLAASADEKCIATGGGDASIRIWDLEKSNDTPTTSGIIPLEQLNLESDFPRTVRLLSFDTLLVMMNSGSLYNYTFSQKKFDLVFSDPQYKSYSIVSSPPEEKIYAVGSINGQITIVSMMKTKDVKLFEGKVLCIVWLDTRHLLCSGPDGHCVILNILLDDHARDEAIDSNIRISVVHRLFLPASKHRWISGACYIKPLAEDNRYLVCGDKDGSVFVYSLFVDHDLDDVEIEPKQTFFRVHGKTGVTSVCERLAHIYTTGRDGFYRKWELQHGTLVQLHGHKVSKGLEWIDRLEWHNDNLHVFGFYSSYFVVWSVPYNQQLMSVQCGGGHRAWACTFSDSQARFVYLKGSKVYLVESGYQDKQHILSPALHGREVCDVKFVPWQKNLTKPVICTASEDTSISIGTFQEIGNHKVWKHLLTLKGHLSSVRALAVCNSDKRPEIHNRLKVVQQESILFSGGGRAEIRAWRFCGSIQSSFDNIDASEEECERLISEGAKMDQPHKEEQKYKQGKNVNRAAQVEPVCHFEHLCTHYLGESRHKQRFGPWKARKLKLDPETRVMSIDASPVCELMNPGKSNTETDVQRNEEILTCDPNLPVSHRQDNLSQKYITSVAGSDGHLRILSFDKTTKHFTPIAATDYHKCCVLKVLHYTHESQGRHKRSFLLSASTGGEIVLWDLTALIFKSLSEFTPKSDTEEPNSPHSSEKYSDSETEQKLQTALEKEDDSELLKPVHSMKAHQSGVNSVSTHQTSETCVLIASGGDDNAITLHLLEISEIGIKVIAKGSKADAHAAQITGIKLLSQSLVVSASIDQRITVWQLDCQKDVILMKMIACKYINISDVSCLDTVCIRNSVYLCIGGEGICLLKLSVDGKDVEYTSFTS